jgi:hypothetical protein
MFNRPGQERLRASEDDFGCTSNDCERDQGTLPYLFPSHSSYSFYKVTCAFGSRESVNKGVEVVVELDPYTAAYTA